MLTTLNNYLLSNLVVYGLPLLFAIVLVSAIGLPLPVSLVLPAAGALANQDLLSLPWVLAVALLASIAGDHLGYLLGWWGGRRLLLRISKVFGGTGHIRHARITIRRRGWSSIFLSRWLIPQLGPPCNWVCGSLSYPLPAFVVADVLGEAIYVGVLVLLGFTFSDQIENIAELISTAGPWLLAVISVIVLGWYLVRRRSAAGTAEVSPALVAEPTHADTRTAEL